MAAPRATRSIPHALVLALLAVLLTALTSVGTATQATAALVPNEAPDIVLPADGATDEDAAYPFEGTAAISVSDPDAGTDELRLDLEVSSGVLDLASSAGLTFLDGTATPGATIAVSGNLAALSNALDGMLFTPAPDDTSAVTLAGALDDLGHNGDGGPLTDSDSMTITVNPLNDAPVVTVPGTQALVEDSSATFSTGTGTAVTVTDVDAGSSPVQVTLAGTFGTSTLAATSGLVFQQGDGTGDGTSTFSGTLADVNAALDGMTFTPDANFEDVTGPGTATLTVSADDLGNTGVGGAGTDSAVVSFTVSAVNDAPVNVTPSGVGTYAGVAKVLSIADLDALAVNEVDSASGDIEVALTATHGTVQLGSQSGITITSGADNSPSVTFQATHGNANVALDGLTFTPDSGFTGQAQVTIHTDDLGHTGTGGPLTDTDVVPIAVSAPGDTIYWTASKDTPAGLSGSLSRAALDGSGGANLVTGNNTSDTPSGVAIDAVHGRIYWSNSSAPVAAARGLWSANLDGTGRQLFLTPAMATTAGATLNSAFGLVIDQRSRRLYWANSDNVTPANRGISWISLDDTTVGGRLDLTGATVASPRALALDTAHDRVYFTNWSLSQSIAWAALDGSGGGTFAITGAPVGQPSGIAYDAATNRLFWTNSSGGLATERLEVATLPDPFGSSITASTFSIAPLAGGGLRQLAMDPASGRLYYANPSLDQVSYALLDGSGGGADLPMGTAFANSVDGVAILRRPAALGVPAVTGTPAVGATLTCGPVTWASDDPGGALYREPASTGTSWTRNGATIAGATGTTVTASAAGDYRCTRSATNFAGIASAQSAPVSVSAPKLTLGASSVAVSGTGRVTIPVSCANASCQGSLALQTGGAALGSGTFSVAAGGSGSVAIDLTAAGRALVSGRASSDVTAVLAVTGSTTTAAALTLVAARAPKVSLKTGKAHVRAGKAKVELSCGSDGPCVATYVLTATLGGHTKTLASAEVELAAGKTKSLKLKLSKAALSALKDGTVKATQTVTSSIQVGLATTTTRSLKLVT